MSDRDSPPAASLPQPMTDAAEPIYNIKAVAQRTGVPADTVRAWERRYGLPRPERAAGGQRTYSERDVAIIAWLRARTDEGMTISQAVALFASKGLEHERAPHPTAHGPRDAFMDDLIAAFLRYDQDTADAVLREGIALFGMEEAFRTVVRPALVEIGERWHRGIATVAQEHFATQFVKRKLAVLIGAYDTTHAPWTVVVGCPPQEQHEVGALLLTLFMARQGWRVIYLGPDVPVDDLLHTVRQTRPDMVCLSATVPAAAANIARIGAALHAMGDARPILAYGGSIFDHNPQLRDTIPGVFLGEDAAHAVAVARPLLAAR